jgi:hypothetical protein
MRSARVTIEEATARLVLLARANGGSVGAAEVEAYASLACDPPTACAAARQLALEVDIVTVYTRRRSTWFPFDRLLLRTIGPTLPTPTCVGRRAKQSAEINERRRSRWATALAPPSSSSSSCCC